MEAMQTPLIAIQLSRITKTPAVLLQPVISFGWGFPLASRWNELENNPDMSLKMLKLLLCVLKGKVGHFLSYQVNMDRQQQITFCRLIFLEGCSFLFFWQYKKYELGAGLLKLY